MILAAPLLLLQVAACPQRVGALADSGWRAYRNQRMAEAAARFAAVDSLCPGLPDVQLGLGFIALRQGATDAAERRFDAALRTDSLNADGWYGLGLTRLRQRRRDAAATAFRRALALAPNYADAERQLLALGDV
ncbi:MAG: tetratricopeptide repeat protein, partial [Actinomycetota bacterium]